MRKGIPIPNTLKVQIERYLEQRNLQSKEFARKCGLSDTVISAILLERRTMYSKYSAKRINGVLHNGLDYSQAPRLTRKDCNVGELKPVPAWVISPLRACLEKDGQTQTGRKIGIDGSALKKVCAGNQVTMRAGSLEKVVNYLRKIHPGQFPHPITLTSSKPNNGRALLGHKTQPELPIGVHCVEMNSIIDAFNHWTDAQREAMANLAHAFRRTEVPATKDQVEALTARITDLEAKLASAETDATMWQNEYEKLRESVTGLTKTLSR